MREILERKGNISVLLVDDSKYLPMYKKAAEETQFQVVEAAGEGQALTYNNVVTTIKPGKIAICVEKPEGRWKNFNSFWKTFDPLVVADSEMQREFVSIR